MTKLTLSGNKNHVSEGEKMIWRNGKKFITFLWIINKKVIRILFPTKNLKMMRDSFAEVLKRINLTRGKAHSSISLISAKEIILRTFSTKESWEIYNFLTRSLEEKDK